MTSPATWRTMRISRSRRLWRWRSYAQLCEMTGKRQEAAEYRKTAEGVRQAVDGPCRRRRPLPTGLRQAGHVEPEIQPGLGSSARVASLPARSGAARRSLFIKRSRTNTGCRWTTARSTRSWIGSLWTATLAKFGGGLREDCGAGVPVSRMRLRPRAADRLVLDAERQAVGLSGAVGGGRGVY